MPKPPVSPPPPPDHLALLSVDADLNVSLKLWISGRNWDLTILGDTLNLRPITEGSPPVAMKTTSLIKGWATATGKRVEWPARSGGTGVLGAAIDRAGAGSGAVARILLLIDGRVWSLVFRGAEFFVAPRGGPVDIEVSFPLAHLASSWMTLSGRGVLAN